MKDHDMYSCEEAQRCQGFETWAYELRHMEAVGSGWRIAGEHRLLNIAARAAGDGGNDSFNPRRQPSPKRHACGAHITAVPVGDVGSSKVARFFHHHCSVQPGKPMLARW